jgi:hypothetical protein
MRGWFKKARQEPQIASMFRRKKAKEEPLKAEHGLGDGDAPAPSSPPTAAPPAPATPAPATTPAPAAEDGDKEDRVWLSAYCDPLARLNTHAQGIALAAVDSPLDYCLVAADMGDFSDDAASLKTYNGTIDKRIALADACSQPAHHVA